MSAVDAIIFDMDGLLIDSEKVYRDGWIYALHKNELDIEEDVVNSWVGKSIHETGSYLSLKYSEEVVNSIREDRESYIYDCLYANTLKAKSFAKEVLQMAKQEGFITGLATSTNAKRGKDILQYLGLYDYIDYPVFGSEVERLKPFPDLYEEALVKMKRVSSQAIAVEDSLTGAKAAQAAHIATILVPDINFNEKQTVPSTVFMVGKDLHVLIDWIEDRE